MRPSSETVEWLKEGEPYVRYMTLTQLDGPTLNRGERDEAKAALLADPAILSLAKDVATVPWPPMSNHRSADHPLHKLAFLAELEVGSKELGIEGVLDGLTSSVGEDGMLRLPIKISKSYGGKEGTELSWMLCDSPTLVYSLLKFDWGQANRVATAADRLSALVRENGYPCATDRLLSFRGPGRKDDPCPYADLIMLKLLSVYRSNGREAKLAAETLLHL